jgi:aconitase B
VALPHSPANARAVTDVEPTAIDVAYIGACTGAKLDDLRAAARVLAGRTIASGVQFLVAPASLEDAAAAEARGHPAAAHRRRCDAAAQCMRSVCRVRRGDRRRRQRHFQHRAQLQGAHGRRDGRRCSSLRRTPSLRRPCAGRISDAREVLA